MRRWPPGHLPRTDSRPPPQGVSQALFHIVAFTSQTSMTRIHCRSSSMICLYLSPRCLTLILQVIVNSRRVLLRSSAEETSKSCIGTFLLMRIYVLMVERAREASLPRSDLTSPSVQPKQSCICRGESRP